MDIKFNTLSFQSKIANKEIISKSTKIAAAIGAAAGISAAAELCSSEKLEKELDERGRRSKQELNMLMDAKAKRIQNVITRKVHKNENITIKEISRRTKIPENQIVSIIYNRANKYTALRELFDLVKDKTHVFQPATDSDINLAKKITNAASLYKTTDKEELIIPESDYIKNLSNNIRSARIKGRWTDEVLERFAEYFNIFPAFADTVISTTCQNNNKLPRSISTGKSLDMLFASYSINPEMTEKLTTEFDESGFFKYSISNIYKIASICKEFPELEDIAKEDTKLVYWLFSLTDNSDNRRFWGDDIIKLYQYYKEFPELTKTLIQDIEHIETFKNEEDKETEKNAKLNKDLTEESSDEEITEENDITVKNNIRRTKPKFTADEIFYIIEHYNKAPALVSFLIKGKYARTSRKYHKDYIIQVLNEKEEYTQKNLFWEFSYVYSNEKELKEKGIRVRRKYLNDFIPKL